VALTLDTLEIAKHLRAAGLDVRTAEALAEGLQARGQASDQRLVTTADLVSLRRELARVEGRLETRIVETKFDLLIWGAIVPLLAAHLLVLIGLYLR
jgi:2-phosphoglycerate kinase